MADEVNILHELLPKMAKGTWRMSMREVDAYLRKIDSVFRIDEIKLEARQSRLGWSELVEEDIDFEMTKSFLNMDRAAYETSYNLFIKSSCVMIYSVFETTLCLIAQLVSDVAGSKEVVKEYEASRKKISGIERYKRYLTKIHRVDWKDLGEVWRRINNFRIVRNIVVHGGGRLDAEEFHKFDRLSDPELGLSRDGEIIQVEMFYLARVVDSVKEFFEVLCQKLDGRVFVN